MRGNPFVDAAESGDMMTVARLLQTHHSEIPRQEIAEALSAAAFNGRLEIVQLLIESGVDPNTIVRGSWTALYQAIKNWQPEIVVYLLEHGAEVNIADEFGQTPLHISVDIEAVAGTNWDQVPEVTFTKLLLAHGADVNARTTQGETPLDWAIKSGGWHPVAEALLKEHGALPGNSVRRK